MRKQTWFIPVGIVLFVAAVAGGWYVLGKEPPRPHSGWDLLPANPLVQVEFSNMERWNRAVRRLEGVKKLDNVEVDTTASKSRSRKLGQIFLEVLPGVPSSLFRGMGGDGYIALTEMGIGLEDVKLLGSVGWSPPPSPGSSSRGDSVGYLQHALIKNSEGAPGWSRREYNGVDLFHRPRQVVDGETVPSITLAPVGKNLVVGVGQSTLETAIERYADHGEMGSGPDHDRNAHPEVHFAVSEAFWERLLTMARTKAPGWKDQLQDSLTGAYGKMTGRAGFQDGHFQAESEVDYKPKKLNKTWRRLFEDPPAELKIPSFLPSTTIWGMAQRLPGKPALFSTFVNDVIGAVARHSSDPRRAMAARLIQSFLPTGQIKELLATLGEEGGLGLYVDAHNLSSEDRSPDRAVSAAIEKNSPFKALLIHEVQKPEAFRNRLESLINGGIVSHYVNYDRQQGVIRFAGTGSIPSRTIPVGFHRNFLLVGSDTGEIEAARKRHDRGKGLPNASHYRTVRRKLPRKLNSLTFLAVSPLAPLLRSDRWEQWSSEAKNKTPGFRLDRKSRLVLANRLEGVPGSMAAHWTEPSRHRVHSRVLSFGDLTMLVWGAWKSLNQKRRGKVGRDLFTQIGSETTPDPKPGVSGAVTPSES